MSDSAMLAPPAARRGTDSATWSAVWSAKPLAHTLGAQLHSADGIPYISGELWTARQRQAHSIHEISYRACFKPQLPELLINLLTRERDIVLDPFLGRGTTAVQAALMNRIAYGSDANPLSAMLTAPRLQTPLIAAVAQRLQDMPATADIAAADAELSAFYHPTVLQRLVAMKQWFIEREKSGQLDNIDRWIRMVATNRLTGHSPGFFSVRTMPPNQAVSVEAQRRINEQQRQTPPEKDIAAIILKKSRSLLRSGGIAGGVEGGVQNTHKLACTDAGALRYIKDGEVSAVITSPPFLNVVNYALDNWLRCWFTGIEISAVNIASHAKVEDWTAFIARCLSECVRVVKAGGHIAMEVGEAKRGTVLLEHAVLDAAKELPLTPVAVLLNQQQFTKTANCWGVENNRGGTNTNRIVLLRRE